MPSMWTASRSGPRYQPLLQGVELQPADGVTSTDNESESTIQRSSSAFLFNENETESVCDNSITTCINGDGALSPWKRAKVDGKCSTSILLCVALSMILLVTSLSLGLGGYSVFIFKPAPFIDKSVEAFSIPNHKASIHYHAFQAAKSKRYRSHISKRSVRESLEVRHQSKRSMAETNSRSSINSLSHTLHNVVRRSYQWTRCSRPQECIQWKLQVIFKAVDGENDGNIFTEERLATIHDIENKIVKHPRYADFCWKNYGAYTSESERKQVEDCAPLSSLLTYFYPTKLPNGQVRYDGRGENMANINTSLDLAMSHKSFYYFVDENIDAGHRKSKLLRTEIIFGSPLQGFRSSMDRRGEEVKLFKKFMVSYIDMLSTASTSKVKVLYGGNEVFDYEVETTFWNDLWLARFALIFIGLFIFVLTSFSLWLTVWGLVAIGLSFPIAIFFYRVVFNIQALGILNGAAAFVVIGIGVDDVFVFVNTFRQAEHMDRIKGRLLYTVKTAGKATFFTSFTTAAAFAANIVSTIPALHEFGLFMALIVACCWLTVVLIIPPVLYFWYLIFSWLEGAFFRALKRLFYKVVLRKDIETLQVYYRSGSDEILTDGGLSDMSSPTFPLDDDDDVPMLTLEEDEQHPGDSGHDEPLLVPYISSSDSTYRTTLKTQRKGRQLFDLGYILQVGLCKFVTKPVIKARWVVAAIYFTVLITSIGIITQIKTSSKPPQLFKETTNLQMMLDLKANLSIDNIFCPDCSGLYANNPNSSTKSPNFPEIPPNLNISHHHGDHPENIPYKPTSKPQKSYTTKGGYQKHHTTSSVTQKTTLHRTTPVTRQPVTEHFQTTPLQVPTTTSLPFHQKTKNSLHVPVQTTTTTTETPSSSTPKSPSPGKVNSVPKGFKVCQGDTCGKAEERPVMESRAVVYVVFGIKDLDRSNLTSEHVISDNYGAVVYDEAFPKHFTLNKNHPMSGDDIKELCLICKKIAANSELVINGSAQCLPNMMEQIIGRFLDDYEECHNLPRVLRLYGQRAPAHAEAGATDGMDAVKWMAFAFESTTSKGQSYFKAYDEYVKWEEFIKSIKSDLRKDSPLHSIYQTSEFWTKVMMEVVCVSSAIYGVVLSIIICIISVSIFTGHFLLLTVVLMTIGGIISLVVAVFYMAGWEMGAVEAVSLSILVGSSVDYCVHVVEGYLLAGESPQLAAIESAPKQRQWRVMQAVQHIGVSIVSSAVTTIAAAVPLTQTTILPFSRFGDIVAMNTTFAILYALTVCSAFLAIFGPARFKSSWKSSGIAVLVTLACTGVGVLTLFIMSKAGVNIPSPNGEALFPR